MGQLFIFSVPSVGLRSTRPLNILYIKVALLVILLSWGECRFSLLTSYVALHGGLSEVMEDSSCGLATST